MFNGQAGEAAVFYADLLGGKIENLYRYSDMPPAEGMAEIPEDSKQRIMHCCIGFPGGSMGLADTLPSDPRNFGNGGHILTLLCDSMAQAEGAYAKLCVEAQKIMCELGETFYAKRYGEVVDRYGVLWSVIFEG